MGQSAVRHRSGDTTNRVLSTIYCHLSGPRDRLSPYRHIEEAASAMSITTSPEEVGPRHPGVARVSLGLVALSMLPAGFQAAITPKTFFEDFPLGRGWIAHSGDAYNEHLVRDVGVLFLALIVATFWTVFTHQRRRAVAVAWLVQGLLHLSFHLQHLEGFKTVDSIGLVGSLVMVPALALLALWADRSA